MRLVKRLQAEPGNDFPYPFLEEYLRFEEKDGSSSYYVSSDNEEIIMPVKVTTVLFLKRLNILFPPLDRKGNRLSALDEKDFLNKFIIFCQKEKIADRIAQPFLLEPFQTYPDKSIECQFGQLWIDSAGLSAEEIFKNIYSRDQRYIKAAPKKGALCKFENCVEDFFEVFKTTMIQNELFYHDVNYFKNFQESFPENTLCGVVEVEGEAEGSLFIFYTNYAAFFLYGGALKQKVNGSVKLLHYDAIKILQEKGVKKCVLGGARIDVDPSKKQYGIQKFKEKMGTELSHGFLWKMDINLLKCLLFDAMVSTKNLLYFRKNHQDVIDQEREKK